MTILSELVKIWYVSSQRLCNFDCPYCVSTNDYAKSKSTDWKESSDRDKFERIVRWMASQDFPVGVRLGTLGEPFASKDFLAQACWLTQQANVRFVELLTNGSLLRSRLPKMEATADFAKLSLWITHHHTEISIASFIENAVFAQERYGCFVVVNGLLFPDNYEKVSELRQAALDAGLRFNLDLGYDPGAPAGDHRLAEEMAPVLRTGDGLAQARQLGINPEMLKVNLLALDGSHGQPCAAGHDYLYIGIDGEAYPCSRYYVLKQSPIGNVADPDFRINLRELRWAGCRAKFGCCNKEDFLNLKLWSDKPRPSVPSLGWTGT